MTDRKDLKRRVRARQARTGESYMTALRHVQAQRPSAIPTIELVDLTELGASLGMKCRIAMFPELADRIDTVALLERLRDALLATEGDRELALMRGVVFRGERARTPVTEAALAEAQRFVARARAGIGGVSESGRMLAMPVESQPPARAASRAARAEASARAPGAEAPARAPGASAPERAPGEEAPAPETEVPAEAQGRAQGAEAPERPSLQMLLFLLQLTPDFALVRREPTLVITSPDGLTVDPVLDLIEQRGGEP